MHLFILMSGLVLHTPALYASPSPSSFSACGPDHFHHIRGSFSNILRYVHTADMLALIDTSVCWLRFLLASSQLSVSAAWFQ